MKTNEELALLIANIIESKNQLINHLQELIEEKDKIIKEYEEKEV